MAKVEAADPYARITGRILEQLEQGVRPWTKPWSAEHLGGRVTRPLRATGEPYQGINVLLLWMEAVAAGHPSPTWMTYRQAEALGAQVRKDERGCPVVYFGATTKRGTDEGALEPAGADAAREVRFLKTYTVFNVAQIDGLPERFTAESAPSPALPAPERLAHADVFLGALGIAVRHGGAQAYYSAAEDRIQLPPLEAFHDAAGYYTTWGHEAVHATCHPSRLDRDFGRQRFGDEGYAWEELAELGSAFLAADLWPLSGAPGGPRRLFGKLDQGAAGRQARHRLGRRSRRARRQVPAHGAAASLSHPPRPGGRPPVDGAARTTGGIMVDVRTGPHVHGLPCPHV